MPVLDRLGRPVLVLNASYEPINVCAARRALVLVLKGVATAEEHAPLAIHSARHNAETSFCDPAARISPDSASNSGAFPQEYPDARPVYLPVLSAHAARRGTYAGSRYSALARRRDDLGEPGGVLPSCNNRKGNRTPEEAGMKLARAPARSACTPAAT